MASESSGVLWRSLQRGVSGNPGMAEGVTLVAAALFAVVCSVASLSGLFSLPWLACYLEASSQVRKGGSFPRQAPRGPSLQAAAAAAPAS